MTRCPECGSTRIDTYLMPYGPMWCLDCGFWVEDKVATPNPFLETEEGETTVESPAPSVPLGAALYEATQAAKGAGAVDPPEAGQSGGPDPDPEDD